MSQSPAVRITSFGEGKFEFLPAGHPATIGDALDASGVDIASRRIALNGHPADAGATVIEGDEVTLYPRIEGG
jgi:hypothetical protein